MIPASVRYDKRLNANAKLLYGEITALCNEKGYCWASNRYFAELYEVSVQSISKWIKNLSECGYINMQLEYVAGTKQVKHRYIQMADTPTIEKFKDNNTSNTTINTTKNKGRFTPPTLTEVIDQCNFSGANIDPQGFIDFYESKGWMIGKNKMKCWKSAIRTWARKDKEKKQARPVKQKQKPSGLRGREITDSLTDTSWAD